MPVINLSDLCAGLERDERLIGLDPGSKTIGVALSDVRLKVASPFGTIPRGKLAGIAAELRRLAAREGAGGLVVGLPLASDGRMGPRGAGGARLGLGDLGRGRPAGGALG